MTPDQEKDLINFCTKIESLLSNTSGIMSVNKMPDDNVFEIFFKDENHPIVTSIQINDNKIKEIGRYEAFMQFKVIPSSQHHFSFSVLTAHTPEEMAKEITNHYEKNMKTSISEVKKGFKKDTGQDADDALTSKG